MNEPIRYFEWDYDNDVVIEYRREGECCGCGACCTTVIAWNGRHRSEISVATNGGWHHGNGLPVAANKGVVTEVRVGDKRRFFESIRVTEERFRCGMLTDNNRCRIHIGKHLFSRTWPMSPRHVSPFPECTYTFREVSRHKISELVEVEA